MIYKEVEKKRYVDRDARKLVGAWIKIERKLI